MTFVKFLRPGAVSPLAGLRWPVDGSWIDVVGELRACRLGLHACRPEDMPYWLAEELWMVELDGQVLVAEHKVVARRARLLERVAEWSEGGAEDLARWCLSRTAAHAGGQLRFDGLTEAADRLDAAAATVETARPGGAAAGPIDELRDAVRAGALAAVRHRARRSNTMCSYVIDASEYVVAGSAPVPAYIAARAASQRSDLEGDAYAQERRRQASWLVDRLGLVCD